MILKVPFKKIMNYNDFKSFIQSKNGNECFWLKMNQNKTFNKMTKCSVINLNKFKKCIQNNNVNQ